MIDRFEKSSEIIYSGKRVVIARDTHSDGTKVLCGYVLAKDPVGNEYFQFESTTRDGDRGDGLVLKALIEELKSK